MKKLTVTASAVILLSGSLPAAGTSALHWIGFARQGGSAQRISRMVPLQSTASAVAVRVALPGFFLDEEKLADGLTYAVINAPGAGSHQVGRPDLPVFGETLLIPNGTNPVLEVEPGQALVFEGVNVAPLQPPPTDGERPPFARDTDVYARDDDYPSEFAFLEPVARIRGQEASILWLYPCRYNPARRRLLVYPDLRVTVRFEGRRVPVPARLKSRSFDDLLGRVAINADAVLPGAGEGKAPRRSSSGAERSRASGAEGACEYLIVTHPDFSEAAADLAAWKRKSGLSTHVATTAETGSTAAEIIAYLQDAYDTWNPAPVYVLFVGDAEFIPTNYRTTHPYSGTLVGTDLYYATLDGSDYFPDIITGRISVDTAEQAAKRVNDIIGYETDPVTDGSFYATAAICAQFQHDADGYAERRFAQTSEDLAIYLSDPAYLGEYAVERFYYTGASVTPLYWSIFYFGGGPAGDAGDPIPSYLEKPGFAWDAAAADISAAVNSGRFLVTHRDHGSATGWGSPSYTTGHVSALANGEKIPVVWSVNCSTGFFDKETCESPSTTVSFSESWERNASGGAAGVIAATRVSYSGHNDRLFWGWIDAVWPDFIAGFAGPAASYRRMGDVLNYGKAYYATRYSESTVRKVEFEIFHWFGDPAMMFRTRVPETLSVSHPAQTFRSVPSDFGVTVESGGSPLEGAIVTVYREDVPGDYRTETTDATGTAVFAGLAVSETGEYELVVTAPETVPYQGTFSSQDAPTPSPAPSPAPTAVTWPGSGESEIGDGLPGGFEPSGVVWHERLNVLFVVGDGGQVARMDEDGGGVTVWSPGGDLEGIAVADPATDYLYLGVEDPDSIREFDLASGALTGRSWNLTAWMTGAANSGLEALTFVPDGHHPYPASSSGGLFYAGLQADGKIYVFDVDLSPGGSVTHVGTITPVAGRTDLSGLHYHRENRTLYAIFDGSNFLREMEADGTPIAEYPLPGNDQEGVTLQPSCPSPVTSLFIAEDVGPEVWRYDGYPVDCVAPTPTPTPGPTGTPVPPPTVPPTTTPPPPATPTSLPTASPPVVPTSTPAATPDPVTVVCLGDSVTRGAPYADNGNPHLTYPVRLSVLLETCYGEGSFAVHNQGVNGYRAEDVVNDLLEPGSLAEDPDYVLLMIGGNDLAGATFENIFQIIEETTWEVQSCVDLIKSHTNPGGAAPRVILSAFIPNLLEDGWGTLAVAAYNSSLLSNLSGYDLWTDDNWVDLYDQDTGEAIQSLMFDDVHPNSDGYQVLAENWFNALQVLLSVSPTPTPGFSPVPTASRTPLPTPSPTPTVPRTPPPTPTVTPAPAFTPVPEPTPQHLVVDWDDYDGDGSTDLAICRTDSGEWDIYGVTEGLVWGGGEGDIPAPGDYDGDGKAEVGYFDRFAGRWYVLSLDAGLLLDGEAWGEWGDLPVAGDYDGDTTADLAVFRPSTNRWWIRDLTVAHWGRAGDIPVPGDYNGDGTTDITMLRPSTGDWFVRGIGARRWYLAGDRAMPMDFNGDGSTELAVYRPSTGYWYMRRLDGSYTASARWGQPSKGDLPAVGDFDGDGTADPTCFRPADNLWWIRGSNGLRLAVDFPAAATDSLAVGASSY